jgi:hypothetical protein
MLCRWIVRKSLTEHGKKGPVSVVPSTAHHRINVRFRLLTFGFICLVFGFAAYLIPLGRLLPITIAPSTRVRRVQDDLESLAPLIPDTHRDLLTPWIRRYPTTIIA